MYPEDSEETTLPLDTESHSEMLLPASETSPPSPLNTSSEPDEEPLFAEAPLWHPNVPSPTKSPLISAGNSCQIKRTKKCLVKKSSILTNLCNQV